MFPNLSRREVFAASFLSFFVGCLLNAEAATLAAPTEAKASVTRPTNTSVQWFVVDWKDNSDGEAGFQIRARLGKSGPYSVVATADPNATSWAFAINAQAQNALLQYQVLAFGGTKQKPSGFSAPSNNAEVKIPESKFDAPSGLTATALDWEGDEENAGGIIELKWVDNSTTEEGFAVEIRNEGETKFTWLGTAHFNSSSIRITQFKTPGKIEEFRIRAVRGITPDVGVVDPTHASAYTSIASVKVKEAFTRDITSPIYYWGETALSTYWGESFSANVTTSHPELRTGLSVSGLPDGLVFNTSNATITGIPTKVGTFTATTSATFSSLNQTIAGKMDFTILPPAITSRAFEPSTVGVPFSFQVTTSSPLLRTSLSAVSALPPGLSFDGATGNLSGTPTQAGNYPIQFSASFTDYPTPVSGNMTLRIRPPAGAPTDVSGASTNLSIPQGGTCAVNLSSLFQDPDTGSAVRLQTNLGGNNTIDILLYPDSTPETVASFLKYVDAGDYDGTIFHRSVSGFVVQGGGFYPAAPPNQFYSVPSRPSPKNEPGISNIRGTVAMAKIDKQPDSATTNFFFNLGDNHANLDNQNQGFTAFGRVSASSLAVMDALAAKPTKTYTVIVNGASQSFANCPMNAGTVPNTMDNTKVLQILSARRIPVLSYAFPSPPSSDVANVSLNGETLSLSGLKPGTKDIDLEITDLDGNKITRTLHLTVGQTANGTASVFQFESGTSASIAPANSGNETAFRWLKNGQPLPKVTSANLTFPAIKLTDAGEYRRIATTPGGDVTSSMLVGVLEFSRQPLLVKSGSKTVLSAKVAGPGFSALWKKDWIPLQGVAGRVTVTGAPNPTVTISSFAAADSGNYQCVLHSAGGDGLMISRSVTAVTGGPVVKKTYLSPLVVSQQTSFGIAWDTGTGVAPTKFTITGLPAGLKYDPVTGVISGRPTAAGNYTLSIAGVNAFGKGETKTFSLVVNALPAGALGKFSAYVPADAQLNGGLGGVLSVTTLPNGTFTGLLVMGTAKYPISGLLETGPGVTPHFTLSLKLPAELKVSIASNALTGTVGPLTLGTRNLAFTSLVVSQLTSNLAPGWDQALGLKPVRFEVSGLPPGMTFDPLTGALSGRPTQAGLFKITIVAVHASGTREERTIPLTVSALPTGAVGTFVALVPRDATLNAGLGGLLTVTVSAGGGYSGNLVLGTDSYPIKGVVESGGSNPPKFSTNVKRKNASQVEIKDVTLNASLLSATLTEGNATVNISGGKTVVPSAALTGLFNTRFSIPAADSNLHLINIVPQGHGFASVTTDNKGAVKIVGKLADGTSLLASSSFGFGGRVPLHVIFPSKKDVLLGTALITQTGSANPALSGAVEWLVASSPKLVFPANFGPQALDWKGAKYLPPAKGTIILGLLDKADNAALSFFDADLANESGDPDLTFRIKTDNSIVLPATNPALVGLKIDPLKGTFSGTFQFSDIIAGKPVPRKSTFQGLLITGSRGFGYFTLPQRADSSYKPALSGAVELSAP